MGFPDNLKGMRFNLLVTKRNGILFLIIAALLGMFFFRGCDKEGAPRKHFYTIGRDNTWYPFHLRGKDRNLIAFTDELMTAIAAEARINWNWVETSPSNLLEGLNNENYDAAISTLQPNFFNRNQYVFSDLFFELGLVLVVRQNSMVTSLKDLQGKSLGISTSSFPIINAIREGGAYSYNIHLVVYDNVIQGLDMLENGSIDGIITHTSSAYSLIKTFNKDSLKVATAPFTDEGLRLITLKDGGSEALIEDFNQALKKLKDNGVYAKLIIKWDLIDPSVEYLKTNQSP